ncbi:MAG: HypC/HybG/HupF family hydrogenase formation chaperone [Phycisphaerae bacterium]
MCLAVPGRIVEMEAGAGVVDVRGNRIRAGLALVPDAGVGDWVLLHAGFAITKITPDDAAETNVLLDEMDRLAGVGGPAPSAPESNP